MENEEKVIIFQVHGSNMLEERSFDYGFMTIFWGLVITFFDFRINGFNLIPDFVGYVLVMIGVAKTMRLDYRFGQARTAAIILIPLSLPDIIEFPAGDPFWPISIISGFCYLVFIWVFLGGIKSVAESHGNASLAELAYKVLIATFVIRGVNLTFSLIVNLLGSSAGAIILLVVPLVFVGLLVGVLVLYVVYRASQEISLPAAQSEPLQ
ncbi:MAG: hypothetical protein P1Q69_10790 [Candidatus Thorarchaeota archaeon]|nr:hypothetical protein [Candidatus Thorarchaeota archaeon]